MGINSISNSTLEPHALHSEINETIALFRNCELIHLISVFVLGGPFRMTKSPLSLFFLRLINRFHLPRSSAAFNIRHRRGSQKPARDDHIPHHLPCRWTSKRCLISSRPITLPRRRDVAHHLTNFTPEMVISSANGPLQKGDSQ